ncbi:MAG: PHP domain-containing protein [Candidatus Cloacimonadota bacterium]|nr:PHP domain-containing protein [Candidatus Cloacimonadota bacterium]
MKLDLHTHTTVSDGSDSPTDVIKKARKKDLQILSITDHDTIGALDEIKSIPNKMKFITGVEISAEFPKTLHILGYNFDSSDKALRETLNSLQNFRKNRNIKMMENMEKMGIFISWAELKEEAKGEIIGRPHFANILYKKGYVDSYQQAFDKYLKQGAPLYLNKKRLFPKKAIELILNAGGVPVIAHPYQTKLNDEELRELIKKLADYGLQGIEAFYSLHTKKQIELYLGFAKEFNLVITAGSDYHGTNKPNISLGMEVEQKYINPFFERAGILL